MRVCGPHFELVWREKLSCLAGSARRARRNRVVTMAFFLYGAYDDVQRLARTKGERAFPPSLGESDEEIRNVSAGGCAGDGGVGRGSARAGHGGAHRAPVRH